MQCPNRVQIDSKSKKKLPTSMIPGDESWRHPDTAATPRFTQVETGAPKVNRRDVTKKCRELAGKLSRGDVTHETAKDLSDDDGYLHSDDEGITDLPLASSLVEHALDALVEQGEVKKTGDDYALVVDDDGDWFGGGVPANRVDRVRTASNSKKRPPTSS